MTFTIDGFRLIVSSLFAFASLLILLAPAQAEITIADKRIVDADILSTSSNIFKMAISGSGTTGPTIKVADTSAAESDDYIVFPITLSQELPNHIVVCDVAIEGGTATPNVDYWLYECEFTIDMGDTNLNVNIPLRDDTTDEDDETLKFKLINARIFDPHTSKFKGTVRIVDGEAIGTIIDDTSDNKLISIVPHPFNPSTQITYRLPASGAVRLRIYNILGQPVRTLVDEVQVAGRYQVLWDGRDEWGATLAPEIYQARLIYSGGDQTQWLLLFE